MFTGEYLSPLGEKNRVALPKRLREMLVGDRAYLTRGYERCLLMVDESHWQNLVNVINAYPLLNLSVRDTKRFLLGGAFEIILDKQGRFVIPEGLVHYSGLEAEIVFLGVGEWIEIWQKDTWEQKLEWLSKNSADVADSLGKIV